VNNHAKADPSAEVAFYKERVEQELSAELRFSQVVLVLASFDASPKAHNSLIEGQRRERVLA
jgi:hypothetical protein